jgi:hypothetical protein
MKGNILAKKLQPGPRSTGAAVHPPGGMVQLGSASDRDHHQQLDQREAARISAPKPDCHTRQLHDPACVGTS